MGDRAPGAEPGLPHCAWPFLVTPAGRRERGQLSASTRGMYQYLGGGGRFPLIPRALLHAVPLVALQYFCFGEILRAKNREGMRF